MNTATTAHVSGTITLALFAVNRWSCDDYWYILGFLRYCMLIPCGELLYIIFIPLQCSIITVRGSCHCVDYQI